MLQIYKNIIRCLLAAWAMTAHAEAGDSPLSLLKEKNFSGLEKALAAEQAGFEAGKISEIELRNAYRPFYELDNALQNNVEAWESAIPASYSAHLIRGIWYKRRAVEMRGTAYIADTPPEALEAAHQLNAVARTELETSLKLTSKPYLSMFHLLGISLNDGSQEDSLALLNVGNRMVPTNTLLRNRYMMSLEPRWGGSYDNMERFIARSKAEGASRESLTQLEAIMHDDMGHSLMERRETRLAVTHLAHALELAKQVRSAFRQEFLPTANYYSCRIPDLKKYCE